MSESFHEARTASYGSTIVTFVRNGRRISIRGAAGDRGLVSDCYDGGAKWDKSKREFYVGTSRAADAEAIFQRIAARLDARRQHDDEEKRRLDAKLLLCSPHTVQVSAELKALGGWWNPDRRGWLMPTPEALTEAHALLAPYIQAERDREAAAQAARAQRQREIAAQQAERDRQAAARRSEWRTITTQYPGTCCVCGRRIPAGQTVQYRKASGVRHTDCQPIDRNTLAEGEIVISGGSGYGCRGWAVGQVLHNRDRSAGSMRDRFRSAYDRRILELAGERPPVYPSPPYRRANEDDDSYEGRLAKNRADEELLVEYRARVDAATKVADSEYPLDGPEWLMVLRTSQQYVRDDGMSFGVGDESGFVYTAVCRAATPEEAAPLIAELAAQQAARRHQARLTALFDRVFRQGEAPITTVVLTGARRYLSEQDRDSVVYGGGRWFVIENDQLWAVRNNGHDGDDWSRNNVRTGGAGAIGRYLPLDEVIDEAADLLGVWVATPNDVY